MSVRQVEPVRLELLYTLGCHLCEQAEQVLEGVASVYPLLLLKTDIATLPEQEMWQWAQRIPVLRLESHELGWPFSSIEVAHRLDQLASQAP